MTCQPTYGNVDNPFPLSDLIAPDSFYVAFFTNLVDTKGNPNEPIIVQVTRSWAPLGADRFFSLINDGYYNCSGVQWYISPQSRNHFLFKHIHAQAFFRVVPGFVAQFGIAASPFETSKWNTTIPDDLVQVSNLQWTISYATG